MLAVLNGHTECVYSLLSQGASVENRDRWGRTALHRGVRCPPRPPISTPSPSDLYQSFISSPV